MYQGVDNMSEKEIQKYVEEMKKFAKSKSRSKKNVLEFLVKAGICDNEGQLKPQYR